MLLARLRIELSQAQQALFDQFQELSRIREVSNRVS